jgi:2,3-bisphosphoglycerate-independent phosphoglycerate mutase
VLEALGAGVDLAPRDVAVLAHVASVRETEGCLVLEEGVPWVSDEDAETVIREIAEYETNGVRIRFTRTNGLFGIVTLSGDVAPQVTDTDPVRKDALFRKSNHGRNTVRTSRPDTAAAIKAYLLWAYHRLRSHPSTCPAWKEDAAHQRLVTHRAGRLKPVPPFRERYGLRGLSISSGLIYGDSAHTLASTSKAAGCSDRPAISPIA